MAGMTRSVLSSVHFKAIAKSDLVVGKPLRYDRSQPQEFSQAKVFVPSRVRIPSENERNGLAAFAEALLSAIFRSRGSDDYLWVKGHWYSLDGSSTAVSKELRKEFRADFWSGVNHDFSPMSPDWQPKTWKSFLKKLWDTKFTFRL